jgi:hypothetical protein
MRVADWRLPPMDLRDNGRVHRGRCGALSILRRGHYLLRAAHTPPMATGQIAGRALIGPSIPATPRNVGKEGVSCRSRLV